MIRIKRKREEPPVKYIQLHDQVLQIQGLDGVHTQKKFKVIGKQNGVFEAAQEDVAAVDDSFVTDTYEVTYIIRAVTDISTLVMDDDDYEEWLMDEGKESVETEDSNAEDYYQNDYPDDDDLYSDIDPYEELDKLRISDYAYMGSTSGSSGSSQVEYQEYSD